MIIDGIEGKPNLKPSSPTMFSTTKICPSIFQSEWQEAIDGDWWERKHFWKNLTLKQSREFIAEGADVKYQNKRNETPLHHTVIHGVSVVIIKELIKFGADIHAKDYKGRTSLHFVASHSDNAHVIKTLIKAGANINAKDKNGATPLHVAAFLNRSIKIIKALINEGADVNAKDNDGERPYDYLLHNSKLKNNKKAIALLK